MTAAIVELAGPDAAAHDFHAGRTGAFAEALAALTAARAAGAVITVDTPLTRSSYRALAGLPVLLRRHHVARWRLRVLADTDVAAAAVPRTIPRLAMALPHALHAAERARRLGLPTVIVDAPRCLLGPFAAHAEVTRARAFAPACDLCAARAQCPGVDAGYLARFGGEELTAIA
ncbi:MAG: hypothetical protein IPH44_04175 [Myxococcales bacterium]|nr:hypothetical protein [Myxococcales bacterium]MBK7193850.1 hypothetical protein [Myxococcales bacterium]